MGLTTENVSSTFTFDKGEVFELELVVELMLPEELDGDNKFITVAAVLRSTVLFESKTTFDFNFGFVRPLSSSVSS